jgi:hypothetical protein
MDFTPNGSGGTFLYMSLQSFYQAYQAHVLKGFLVAIFRKS